MILLMCMLFVGMNCFHATSRNCNRGRHNKNNRLQTIEEMSTLDENKVSSGISFRAIWIIIYNFFLYISFNMIWKSVIFNCFSYIWNLISNIWGAESFSPKRGVKSVRK